MNICYVNSTFGINDYKGGGLKTHLQTIPFELARHGHNITIVTSGNSKPYIKQNVRIIELYKTPMYSYFTQMINPLFIYKKLAYMYKVSTYLSSHRFDIVEFADTGFEQLFCFFKKTPPLVTRLHGSFSDVRPSILNKVLYFFEKVVVMKSDFLVSPSPSYRNYCLRKYKVRRNVQIIPNGIETSPKYKKVDVRKKYNIPQKNIILFVAMLSKRKGMDILLETAKTMKTRKDTVFILLGGNLERYRTEDFPTNILYLGHKGKDELHSFYEECTLLFSPTRFETFGLNIAEAMSHGKPIVASNTIGVCDVVKNNQNGYLFETGNAKEALGKIEKLLNNKTLRKEFGKRSKKLAQEYEVEKVTKITEEYFKKVVSLYE